MFKSQGKDLGSFTTCGGPWVRLRFSLWELTTGCLMKLDSQGVARSLLVSFVRYIRIQCRWKYIPHFILFLFYPNKTNDYYPNVYMSLSFQTPCKLEVIAPPKKKTPKRPPQQDMRLAEAEDLKVSEMALTGVSSKKSSLSEEKWSEWLGFGWCMYSFAVVFVQQFSGAYVFMFEVLASLHFLWALDFCYTRNFPKTNCQKRGWIFFVQTNFF